MSSIITIQQTPTVHGEQLATAFEEDAPRHIMMPSLSEEATGNASLGSDDPDASEEEHEPWAIHVSPANGNESELDITNSPSTPLPMGHHSSSSSREGGDEDEGPATASEGEDDDVRTPSGNDMFSIADDAEISAARKSSLEMLQGNRPPALPTGLVHSAAAGKSSTSRSPKKKGRRRSRVPEGFIILKEERATIFHDFLKFVYPQ